MLITRTSFLLAAAICAAIASGADDAPAAAAAEENLSDRIVTKKGVARQTANIESSGIYAEAESGSVVVTGLSEEEGSFQTGSDETASGGIYLHAKSAERGSISIPVLIASDGEYFLWFRMQSAGASSCALYVSVDGGPEEILFSRDPACTSEWQWLPFTTYSGATGLQLSEGWHDIRIRARDADIGLDKIALLTGSAMIPEDIAATADHVAEPGAEPADSKSGMRLNQSATGASVAAGFNRMGIVNYGANLVSGTTQQTLLQFQANKYDIFIGGASPLAYTSAQPIHTSYRDMSALYPEETWQLKATAEKYGFNYEDMLLHMRTNYKFSDGRYGWAGMGRFDACETWYGGASTTANSSKGVFLIAKSGAYSDATTAAWNTTTADVRIENQLLLGYCEPFDQAEFQLSTPASSGISVVWEYWDGAKWARLTLISDTSTGLKRNGIVRFRPPSNWKTKSENGSRSKWWVRATVTGSGTTPVASRILADDLSVPGQPYTWRGWDAASSTRVNVGLGPLEYNPTPPSTATARFRYQARLLGIWTTNLHFGNPANVQKGIRTWARYLAEASHPVMVKDKASGLFFDDAAGKPSGLVSPAVSDWQNHTELAGRDHLGEHIETYKVARDHLRTLIPGARVCANNATWELVRQGDCFLIEFAAETHKGAVFHHALLSDKRWWSSGSYDQVAPENNPGGTKGVFTAWDTAGSDFMANGSYVAWDRGNRGPVTALAAYYIFANENTRFGYNTEGWVYRKTDHFQYVDATPSFRTSAAIAQNMTSGSVKYISGDFTSFPSQHNSSSNRLLVKIGSTGEYLPVWKVSNTQLATNDVIAFAYPSGTGIFLIREGTQSTITLPPAERIVMFNNWFPAVGVSPGLPDAKGLNGGRRVLTWKTAAESGTAGGVQRRDFTNAIVLHAPGSGSATGTQLSTYGVSLALGGTFYPLKSDGTTGAGISSIRLRTAEGAILMKAPVTR